MGIVSILACMASTPSLYAECLTPQDFSPTFDAATQKVGLSSSNNAAVAAQIPYHFPYVNETISKLRPQAFCVSALALSKNAYNYYLSAVVIHLVVNGEIIQVPMLMQMASVQAFENRGPKPWVALDKTALQSAFEDLVTQSRFESVEGAVTVDLFKSEIARISSNVTKAESFDVNYLGSLSFDTSDGEKLVLVSQIKSPNTRNIYTTFYSARGWLLRLRSDGTIREVAAVPSLFEFQTAIGNSNIATNPRAPSRQKAALLKLIEAQPR